MSIPASGREPRRAGALRILILSQFFAPEPCAAANRVGALAHALAERGHDVTVLTGLPNFPSGRVDAAFRGTVFSREARGGASIERVWTFVRGRLATWGSVAFGASLRVLFSRRYDAIVVSSPPITLALPALLAKLRHRAPLFVDIRDVFPDVAVAMGEWKSDGVLARTVGFVARVLYRAARLVVCVTPAAAHEIGARGVPSTKVLVAPNGFDAIDIGREPAPAEAGRFVAAYVGNIGLATGLDVMLDAAALLRDEPQFRFVLVGDGADSVRLRRRMHDDELTNVHMAGVLPRAQALGVLADADACIVPLRSTIRDSLPTKLFDAMFVGCPIVVSAEGEARRVVEESQAGIAVRAGDGAAMADALRTLALDPELRRQLGARGREYVAAHYDRAAIMRDLAATIERCSARGAVVDGYANSSR